MKKNEIEELYNSRGKKWAKIFKSLDSDDSLGGRLRSQVIMDRAAGVKISLRYLVEMASREGLRFRTLFRMLEDGKALPSGTWDKIKNRIKVTDIMDAAREAKE